MALLSVNDLGIAYKVGDSYYDAVRSVSFEIQYGGSIALVGESGSGKSTIGHSILGLLPKNAKLTSGQILFEEKNLAALSREEIRSFRWKEISMIFQGSMNALDPIFKVGDQMNELLEYHQRLSKKDANAISEEYLTKVGLKTSVLNLYPHELSGGMKQRVVIALALLLKSKLLIADEPTTALDVTTQAEIVELLIQLKSEHKMSMIFITHDLSLVENLCEQVVVMYGGAVMERGETSAVFSRPMNPYTKGLVGSVLTLDRKEAGTIPGDPPNLMSMPPGCPFNPRCPSAFAECGKTFPRERQVKESKVRCLLYQ
ncbi:MAG TPA: ABC transporter ATP-binding protein [Nitrososphaerales archaeon]|nr:ABC transporter ATP-binding protein [Nitrososphaerales archaeon]